MVNALRHLSLHCQHPYRSLRGCLALAAWSVLVTSLPAHKEFRFLLPALQLLMPLVGAGMHRIAGIRSGRRPLIALLFACQFGLFAYFGLVHHR